MIRNEAHKNCLAISCSIPKKAGQFVRKDTPSDIIAS